MPLPRDTSTRLAHIEEILAQTASGAAAAISTGDATAVHLNSVPVDRIRRLTADLLHTTPADQPDVIDAVVMRLLLDEFATAVTHLRAVAYTTASRVDAAAAPLREARRTVHRWEKAAAEMPPNEPEPLASSGSTALVVRTAAAD